MSLFRIFGILIFAPLSFCWQLLNQFLLSPWGFIVPMTLLIALTVMLQLQKTPERLARFYTEQLETCDDSELPQLLEVLVRIGDAGIPGLIKGLSSKKESVFTASRNMLQHQLDQWQASDLREHHFLVFTEALLLECSQFSPAAQAEAVRFVDQIRQVHFTAASPEAAADRKKTIAHCEQILYQLENSRRRRIEPNHDDFKPQAETVASLNRRARQPVLLASNGQPFVPTSARSHAEGGTNRTEIASFNAFSVPRADRLQAYHQTLQPEKDRMRFSEDRESLDIASFSPVQGLTAEMEQKIAGQFQVGNLDPQPATGFDISEKYRSKMFAGGLSDSDNFLTPELLSVPLDHVFQLPPTQLMRLLHHPEPQYIESARNTLASRDGFLESHLKLAWRLYHPQPSVRREIVDMLPSTPNVQPSVWLTVLLSDPNNEVRYRTASFLATTNNPTLLRLLIDRGKRDSDERIVRLVERLSETQRGIR